MKKSLVCLSIWGIFSPSAWAKVDCYDVKSLTFSSDKKDQKFFTFPLHSGELQNKSDLQEKEFSACYGTKPYKFTTADMTYPNLDEITTPSGRIAVYTERVATFINTLRAYALVSNRRLCFDTKSYTQPMTTIETIAEILHVEGEATEIRIPTNRLSIKNTNWSSCISDEQEETKERVYSYQGLVFDQKFVLTRLSAEVACYVRNHLKIERWWMVGINASTGNFVDFILNIDDCHFSNEEFVYLADVSEYGSFACGTLMLPHTDPRHKKLRQLRSKWQSPAEYTVRQQGKNLAFYQNNTLQETIETPLSLWRRLTTRKHQPTNKISDTLASEAPPAYTAIGGPILQSTDHQTGSKDETDP